MFRPIQLGDIYQSSGKNSLSAYRPLGQRQVDPPKQIDSDRILADNGLERISPQVSINLPRTLHPACLHRLPLLWVPDKTKRTWSSGRSRRSYRISELSTSLAPDCSSSKRIQGYLIALTQIQRWKST